MSTADLWKYCTPDHCRQFLLSLGLLGRTGWPPEKELACLYAVSDHIERHYRQAQIPKRDGTYRVLHIPDPLLRRIQTNILHEILDSGAVSPHATAYRKGMGLHANASVHVAKPLLLKLDIMDFFSSIHFTAVSRSAFPIRYYPPAVRTMLTNFCCYRECLPQGAPTSPAISNLVMKPFDDHMADWCEARGIAYTRYCDDMTFSGSFDPKAVEHKADCFLQAMGFSLNHRKTKLVRRHQRQMVTGVVVNQTLQAPREYRRKLRQEIHCCRRFGVASHLERTGSPATEQQYLASLLGKVQFVLQINPQDAWFQEAKETVRQLAAQSDSSSGS